MKRTMQMLSLALGMLAALPGIAWAQTQTQTFTGTLPLTTTNFTRTITVPRFDPTLGTLLSVAITMEGQMNSHPMIENLDARAGTIIVTRDGQVCLKRPDNTLLAAVMPPLVISNDVAAYDGVMDCAGPSGVDCGICETYETVGPDIFTAPADLAIFTGTEPVALPIIATASYQVRGPGNVYAYITTEAGANVKVTYTYLPASEGATRTPGYWKTHLFAMQTAVDRDCIDLGVLSGVTPDFTQDLTNPALGDVMAIFWGKDTHQGRDRRTALGQARMQLANHLIAAMANVCLLGTTTAQQGFSPTLIQEARAALDGTNIALMNTLMGQLDLFNNSGNAIEFTPTQAQIAGPADPNGAKAAANRDGTGEINPGPAFR